MEDKWFKANAMVWGGKHKIMEKMTIHPIRDGRHSADDNWIFDNKAILPPVWMEGKRINEIKFRDHYLTRHPLYYVGNKYRDVNGLVHEDAIKREIIEMISPCITHDVMRCANKLIELIRSEAGRKELPINENEIQFKNGTYYVGEKRFTHERTICLNPLPVIYNPKAPRPEKWLAFLNELFYEEDILCLQEYFGYVLVQHTKGQSMLIILGKGGEGKSVIYTVLRSILGENMEASEIHKLQTDKFALANLSGKLLMLDEDMKLEALPSTNILKKVVTSKYEMDLEEKNKQSYQGRMYVRLMGFSNKPLHALHDDSTGFYRRQLYIKVKPRRTARVDDAYIDDKLLAETEGILLWCLEGLERLKNNGWHFTVSERMKNLQKEIREADNNILEFLQSAGYIEFERDAVSKTSDLLEAYRQWCNDNATKAQGVDTFSRYIHENQDELHLRYDKYLPNEKGKNTIRGYHGVRVIKEEELK